MDSFNDPILNRALDFARLSLAGKKRKSGEDVVAHCVNVARKLQSLKIDDTATLTCALIHHSLHEGAATIEDIQKEFGSDVAMMMDSFEKLRIVRPGQERNDEFAENLRKMFLVLAKDIRIVLIKMADILDNLETLQFVDEPKRIEVARKTLEIFAPLAERLGMGELRGKMQDLAFQHLDPAEYEWVNNYTKSTLEKLGKMLLRVKAKILVALEKEGIQVEVQSRVKHIYSLYRKLNRPEIDKDLSKVVDLIALRIIVDETEDCYKVLDIIHKLYQPLPDRISDYITHPKPNGYQSIHTKYYGPANLPFEVQIRTKKMHQAAEYGLAAHWNYSEKKESGVSDAKLSVGVTTSVEKLEWVKRLCEWQSEITDNQEFLKTIKTDLFGSRIFCFTPKGDVKDLPLGATPVDFAYQVHTDLANRVIGAKVNGRQVALDTELKNSDVVELMLTKDKNKKPNRDWLQFVVTAIARKKIKRACALD